MISVKNGVFHLQTANTSYLFDTTPGGKLRHLYYGKRLENGDVAALAVKNGVSPSQLNVADIQNRLIEVGVPLLPPQE